jgi:hypothetical protein
VGNYRKPGHRILYYTPKHMQMLRRCGTATGVPVDSPIKMLVNFATTAQLENVYPLRGGIFRLKHSSDCRAGLPRERAFIFWRGSVGPAQQTCRRCATVARLRLPKFVITRDAAA